MNTGSAPGESASSNRVSRFRRKLLAWSAQSGRSFPWREASATPYVRLVVEVLLQRTRAETVAAFLPGFLEKFPGWEALAGCSLSELSETLRPIGLWRRRAPLLQGLAQELVRRGLAWPKAREELECIPAVGQYVANAVLLLIHGEPHPLMDASMARLLRRYFVILPEKADIRYDKALHAVAYRVLRGDDAVALNWTMLDVAARYCLPRSPVCAGCPLRRSCVHARSSARSSAA